MEEQTPEPMMWKCPLCSADNKVDVETYKICGSCGWGKKMALPDASKTSVGKHVWLWETGKTLAMAIFIATGLFALALKFFYSACGL